MEDNNYCVYRHLKPCGEVFYIGIGKSLKRAYNKHTRSNWWKKVIKKYPNYEVDVLKTGMTKENACELEILLISWYKRIDCCDGTLVNMTDGGEKGYNWIPTEEWREHRRSLSTGEKNPNYGNKWTEEQKMTASKRTMGRYAGENNPMYGVVRESPFKGKKHTEEAKEALRVPKKNPEVYCRTTLINTETGIFYIGLREAFETQNVYKSLSNFSAVLRGEYKNKTSFEHC